MGTLTRAVRNISRRKVRTLLIIVALGFSLAIMISIPAGITANQASTQNVTQNLGNMLIQTESTINQTLTRIDCTLSSGFEGFGFGPGNFTPGDFGGFDSGDFPVPGEFGGGRGRIPGEFGGGAFGGGGNTAMNESLYSDINYVEGVAAVMPTLQVSEGHNQTMEMFGRSFTRLIPDYVIVGIPLASSILNNYPVLPTNITDGRNLQEGDVGVVLLSENNTVFFGAGVGDKIYILSQTFDVIGVHGSSGVEGRTTMYMNLSDAQSVTDKIGYITSIVVFAESSTDVTEVASAISFLHPELQVITAQQRLDQLQAMQANYDAALQNAESALAQTNTTAVQIMGVAVAATSLIVLFVMLYTVRERTKEIGTLKAIGFSNWNVMSQFMLEGILVSLMAGVVGIGIGYVAAPTITSLLLPRINTFGTLGRRVFEGPTNVGAADPQLASVALDPQLTLLMFGAAVLLGALGSLYPAWRASRTSPMEALKYE